MSKTGKVVQIIGPVTPEYIVTLAVAADADGKKLPAKITVAQGETK